MADDRLPTMQEIVTQMLAGQVMNPDITALVAGNRMADGTVRLTVVPVGLLPPQMQQAFSMVQAAFSQMEGQEGVIHIAFNGDELTPVQ